MMSVTLTPAQWLFLERYAIGHGTTLVDLARVVVKSAAPAPKNNKYAQDQKRAQAAIDVLTNHRYGADEQHPNFRRSDAAEVSRLRRALADPVLLWSIYRRADKDGGYGLPIAAVSVRAPRRRQSVAA